MTDTKALAAFMALKGYTATKLAAELGITNASMSYKMRNIREFKLSEAQAIKQILGLTAEERDAIFFGSDVDNLSTGSRLKIAA